MSWGELTTDEMFFCPIYYVPYEEGDENIYLGHNNQPLLEKEAVVQDLKLYPVPATNFLELTFEMNNFSKNQVFATIFNTLGVSVYKEELLLLNNNKHQINISALKKGQYLLELRADDKKITKKFTKQ